MCRFRYLHALIGDREGVARFYEPWAVLADPERNAMLPNIAAGRAVSAARSGVAGTSGSA